MEIFIEVFKQLPAGWPRILLVVVLGLLLALPRARRLLLRGGTGSHRLARAKQLLELRKLQIDVAVLRAQHPDLDASVLDPQIGKLLSVPDDGNEPDLRPLPWRQRIRFAALGAGSFLAIGLLALGVSDRRSGAEIVQLGLRDLALTAVCALVASAIPARARGISVLYGCLVPALVAALAVAARSGG